MITRRDLDRCESLYSLPLVTDDGLIEVYIDIGYPDSPAIAFEWASVKIKTDTVMADGTNLTLVTDTATKLINGFLGICHGFTLADRVQYYKKKCPELATELDAESGLAFTDIQSNRLHPLVYRLMKIALHAPQRQEVEYRLIELRNRLIDNKDHGLGPREIVRDLCKKRTLPCICGRGCVPSEKIRGPSMEHAISCTIGHLFEAVTRNPIA